MTQDTGSVTQDTGSVTQVTGSVTVTGLVAVSSDYRRVLSATNWTQLSPGSYTCVLSGMLAMLDSVDLLETCCHDNLCILLTCIAGRLFENLHRYFVYVLFVVSCLIYHHVSSYFAILGSKLLFCVASKNYHHRQKSCPLTW